MLKFDQSAESKKPSAVNGVSLPMFPGPCAFPLQGPANITETEAERSESGKNEQVHKELPSV